MKQISLLEDGVPIPLLARQLRGLRSFVLLPECDRADGGARDTCMTYTNFRIDLRFLHPSPHRYRLWECSFARHRRLDLPDLLLRSVMFVLWIICAVGSERPPYRDDDGDSSKWVIRWPHKFHIAR